MNDGAAIGGWFVGFLMGAVAGMFFIAYVSNATWRQWLVDEGAAEWRVDKQGETSWHWLHESASTITSEPEAELAEQ